MKWIFSIFLLTYKISLCQYLQNEQKDKYFYNLILQKKSTNIAHISYNNNRNNHYDWEWSKYQKSNKLIRNKGTANFLANASDSLAILDYLQSIDTFYFSNLLKIVELIKNEKLIAIDYSNPNQIYTHDSALLPYFTYDIVLELKNKYPQNEYPNLEGIDNSDSHIKQYDVFLKIDKKKNKIVSIKLLGFISYKNYYGYDSYDAHDIYLGMAGISCYIFN